MPPRWARCPWAARIQRPGRRTYSWGFGTASLLHLTMLPCTVARDFAGPFSTEGFSAGGPLTTTKTGQIWETPAIQVVTGTRRAGECTVTAGKRKIVVHLPNRRSSFFSSVGAILSTAFRYHLVLLPTLTCPLCKQRDDNSQVAKINGKHENGGSVLMHKLHKLSQKTWVQPPTHTIPIPVFYS